MALPPDSLGSRWPSEEPQYHSRPTDYLVGAVLVAIFCCLPFGLFAVYHAAQSRSRWELGDTRGALYSAQRAKDAIIWGIAIGVVVGAIAAIVQIGN